MMISTHVLVGALVGVAVAGLAPGSANVAIITGMVGGLVPDLDMVAAHRKKLHFRVYLPVLSILIGGMAVLRSGPLTIGL